MANESIGYLNHECGHKADVRKNKKNKLYVMCPNCGQLFYNLPGGQEFILNNAVMFGAGGKPEPEQKTENKSGFDEEIIKIKPPEPQKIPEESSIKPASKGGGFFPFE